MSPQQLCVASSCITLINSNRLHIPHERGAERRLPRRFWRQPPFPGCVIDAGQSAAWPRCPQIAAPHDSSPPSGEEEAF